MTVKQLYETRVRDLPTRLFYRIIVTFDIAFVFASNHHACWRSLIPSGAPQERVLNVVRKKIPA